eukprot:gene33396-56016_t
MELQLIQSKIYVVRGHKVLLDSDLALMYAIATKYLKRSEEYELLRCKNGTLEVGRGRYSKYLPYVFTEQGVAMLSSVLNSEKAIELNIYIM